MESRRPDNLSIISSLEALYLLVGCLAACHAWPLKLPQTKKVPRRRVASVGGNRYSPLVEVTRPWARGA